MTPTQPEFALYQGREFVGGFDQKPNGYVCFDVRGRNITGSPTTRKGAIAAVLEAAKSQSKIR
jgi:hypothetical protein